MAGILERLQQRKEDLRSLRDSSPDTYATRMAGPPNRTLSSFGSKAERVTRETSPEMDKIAGELSQAGDRAESSQRLNLARSQQQLSLGKNQLGALNDLRSDSNLGTRKVTGALGDVSLELRKGFKDLKHALLYGNSGSLLDMLDPRRKKGGAAPRGRGSSRGGRGSPGGVLGGTSPDIGIPGRERAPGTPGASSAGKGGFLGKAGNFLGRNGLGIAAGALSALSAYNILSNKETSSEEKTREVTTLAGGTAGAMAGAAAGATLGSVVPGVGTVVGGLAGGALGYMGGSYVTESAQDIAKNVGTWLSESGAGAILGRGAAVVMSPFSEDARKSLVADYQNTILPSLSATFVPVIGAITNFGDSVSRTLEDFWKGTKDTAQNLAEAGTQLTSGVRGAAASVWGGVKAAASRASTGDMKGAGAALKKSGSQAYGEIAGGAQVAAGLARGRYNSSETEAIQQLSAKGEKFRGGKGITADTKGMIAEVAKAQGVDPKALLTMAQIESGGNVNAVSSTGAAGLYQFTGGTARDYKIKNRFDPRENTEAAARLMKDNAAALQKRGIEPSVENLYLAHQQGAGGAAEILNAASGKGSISERTAKNMGLNFGNMTASDYVAANKRKVDAAAVTAQATTYAGTYNVAGDSKVVTTPPTSAPSAIAQTGVKAGATTQTGVKAGTVQTASVHRATPEAPSVSTSSPWKSAETPKVTTAPVQKVSAMAPAEVQKVSVTNQSPVAATPKVAPTVVSSSRSPSSVPDLSEIPPFFPDLSLASIMLGRV